MFAEELQKFGEDLRGNLSRLQVDDVRQVVEHDEDGMSDFDDSVVHGSSWRRLSEQRSILREFVEEIEEDDLETVDFVLVLRVEQLSENRVEVEALEVHETRPPVFAWWRKGLRRDQRLLLFLEEPLDEFNLSADLFFVHVQLLAG